MVSSESEPDSEPDMTKHVTVLPTYEFVSDTCTFSTFIVSSERYEPKVSPRTLVTSLEYGHAMLVCDPKL